MANFLTNKIGDIPVWGWGLAAAGGIGIALFIRSRSQQAIPTGTQASNTSLGNVLPDQSTIAGQVSNPSPSPYINPGGAPTVPPGPGYVPILDQNGTITGWQYGNPGTQGTPPTGTGGTLPVSPVAPTAPSPGTTFLGPTGVTHYVSNGTETLDQIARKLNITVPLSAWNSLETLNKQPATYMPPAGTVITV